MFCIIEFFTVALDVNKPSKFFTLVEHTRSINLIFFDFLNGFQSGIVPALCFPKFGVQDIVFFLFTAESLLQICELVFKGFHFVSELVYIMS